jgi:hypothetical protein
VLRAGGELADIADLALTIERWPRLGAGQGWSALVEGAFWPIGRQLAAPYLFFGLGRFQNHLTGTAQAAPISGISKALGFGVSGRILRQVSLQLEGLIRLDAGAGDDQLRALVGVAPWRPTLRLGRRTRRTEVMMLGMAAFTGPWRLTAPAPGLRFASRISGRHWGGVDLALLHWRIPDPARVGGYAWDTRAALLMPKWSYRLLNSPIEIGVQGGLLLSTMVEGPDDGFRGGMSGGLSVARRLGPIAVTTGADLIWLTRNPRAVSPGGTSDQRAALLKLGLGF